MSELARKKAAVKGDNAVEDDIIDVVTAHGGTTTIGMVVAVKSYLHSEEYLRTSIAAMVSTGKLKMDGERLTLP